MTQKAKSKFLSLVLRHEPQRIGIEMDASGWVVVDDLLEKLALNGQPLSRDELEEIFRTSDKKRFTLSPDKTRIRAAQGHSIGVSLGLEPVEPPAVLYHGTAAKNVAMIRVEGLKPMSRDHVHLSLDRATAQKVGMRHGRPHILRVRAAQMYANGQAFYRAENGVWLTDFIDPAFIEDAE